MLLVRDSNNKIRCAKCYCQLGKNEVVKDRFLPKSCSNGVSIEVNYVGVCADCHKLRTKSKFVLPTYWKHLTPEQKKNLCSYMRGARSYVLAEIDDEEMRRAVERL